MAEAKGGRSLVWTRSAHRYPGGDRRGNINLDVRGGGSIALLGPASAAARPRCYACGASYPARVGSSWRRDRRCAVLPTRRRHVFRNCLFPHLTRRASAMASPPAASVRRRAEAQRYLNSSASVDGGACPAGLSGGQQQRVALARALAIKPSILLLDEPFAALDKNLRLDMQIEVKRLQRVSGITTLIVTHDQEEALSMADRVAVLSQGRLEQFGSPSDVYDRPQTLFVNTFVGSTNRMPGTLVSADPTGAKVRLDAGAEIIARPATKSMTEGGRVTVCIRPEHLQFVTDDSGFAGVVGMALPLGATVVHEVTTADGSGVKISQARFGETRLLESGVAVRIAPLAPSLATAFPASI